MNIDATTIVLILALVFGLLAGYFTFFHHKKKPQPVSAPIPQDKFAPNRLQAYERLILLMERISPSDLVMRYAAQGGSATDLQLLLLGAIRAEMEHNYTQQLYVSSNTWNYVIAARNWVSTIVNQAATALQPEEPAIALSKKIIELAAAEPAPPTAVAIKMLKAEAQNILWQK